MELFFGLLFIMLVFVIGKAVGDSRSDASHQKELAQLKEISLSRELELLKKQMFDLQSTLEQSRK